jgi:tetratricopeptide (TPR) repeat protein
VTRWGLAGILVGALCAAATPVAAANASFASGNEAYQSGDYQEAVRQYEALVTGGLRHEALYYNLGNAYYRLAAREDDKLGRAIYNYERALRVDPGFDDARFNLEVAREAVAGKIADRLEEAERDPAWVRIVTSLSIAQLTSAFLVVDVVLFALLIALRFMTAGFARTGVLVAVIFAALTGAVVGGLLWGHIYFLERVEVAIVLPDEAPLREGPAQLQSDRGQVHAGLRVHVVARDPGWVRVRLANGHEGWLPDATLGEL